MSVRRGGCNVLYFWRQFIIVLSNYLFYFILFFLFLEGYIHTYDYQALFQLTPFSQLNANCTSGINRSKKRNIFSGDLGHMTPACIW